MDAKIDQMLGLLHQLTSSGQGSVSDQAPSASQPCTSSS